MAVVSLLTARNLTWAKVPARMFELFAKTASAADEIDAVIKDLPREGFLDLWRDADNGNLILNVGDWISRDDEDQWIAALDPLCPKLTVEDEAGNLARSHGSYVKIAFRHHHTDLAREKAAASETIRRLGQIGGVLPGEVSKYIPGAPSPLAGMLAGGMIGAGLGYGAGWLGEEVMPDTWEKGRLKRTLALLGAAGGALPGLAYGGVNLASGKNFNDNALTNQPLDTVEAYKSGPGYNPDMPYIPSYKRIKDAGDTLDVELSERVKQAISDTGYDTPLYAPLPTPVDAFKDILINDPNVSGYLSPEARMAAIGATEAAYADRVRRYGPTHGPRMIWPRDMARIAGGMGSGYLSGAIVGKVLGTLMGMPSGTQERLRQTGMFAGAIANVLPLMFGG